MTPARVLVVDDDVELAHNIASSLAPLQVRAEIATSVAQALDTMRTSTFDVAILDLVLPDGDGLTIVPRIHARSPAAEIVLVTGHASLDLASLAGKHQATSVLLKPFTPTRLIATVQAALERRRAQVAQLRDYQNRALCRLTVGLGHELRNPLSAALLKLELASRRLRRADPVESSLVFLADSERELRRVARILTEFEDCVTPAPLSPQRVHLAELVERVLARIGANDLELTIACEIDRNLELDADRDRLGKALTNLIQNAIDAMPPADARLAIRAFEEGERCVIEIEDNGAGIADVDAIFDPFYSTKMGTGLGLNVVWRVVTDHGGTLDVASRPGETIFRIELPRSATVS